MNDTSRASFKAIKPFSLFKMCVLITAEVWLCGKVHNAISLVCGMAITFFPNHGKMCEMRVNLSSASMEILVRKLAITFLIQDPPGLSQVIYELKDIKESEFRPEDLSASCPLDKWKFFAIWSQMFAEFFYFRKSQWKKNQLAWKKMLKKIGFG